MNQSSRIIFAIGCLAFGGCATVQPKADYDRARSLVREGTGVSEVFDPAQEPSDVITPRLEAGLTLDEAVQIALLNNRELQAAFYDIGIAKADWVQSGLLTNPSLGLGVQFLDGGGNPKLTAGIAQNILELWQIPVRRAQAQSGLDESVFRIARRAAELASRTRQTYFRAVAAEQQLRIAEENGGLIKRTAEIVRTQREAGLASDFDENLVQGQVLLGQLSMRNARLESRNARRALAALLSMDHDLAEVRLSDSLPAGPTTLPDAVRLIADARDSRTDLLGLKSVIESAGLRVRFERRAIWSSADLGVAAERFESPRGETGDFVIGPTLSLELPIFDQNQAQIAKADLRVKQAIKLYESLYFAVATEIRTALDEAAAAVDALSFYRDQLIPQAERNLGFARDAYAAGQGSILAVVEAQRTLLEVNRGFAESQLKSAEAIGSVQAATGRPLTGVATTQPTD